MDISDKKLEFWNKIVYNNIVIKNILLRRTEMKFLKSNFMSILSMTLLFTLVMLGDANAATNMGSSGGRSVFGAAADKLVELFKNAKLVIFIIGGFGLVALAFQAIFGKVKWAWFAALAFGLAVVAAASAIITYAANDNSVMGGRNFSDTLGNSSGM